MLEGWVKLYRTLTENDLWLEKPFSKGQAWVDLLLITNHKKGIVKVKNGLTFPVKRGECGYSILGLADRWGWSRGKVDRFLLSLKDEKMISIIDIKTDTKTSSKMDTLNRSVIKVIQYEEYQGTDTKTSSKTGNKTNTKRTLNGHKQECKEGINLLHKLIQGGFEIQKEFMPVIEDWLEYKKNRKETYKSEKGLKAFINRLIKISNNSPTTANDIIETSMANDWKGIFEIKSTPKDTGSKGDFIPVLKIREEKQAREQEELKKAFGQIKNRKQALDFICARLLPIIGNCTREGEFWERTWVIELEGTYKITKEQCYDKLKENKGG